jgi:hypothetical protein
MPLIVPGQRFGKPIWWNASASKSSTSLPVGNIPSMYAAFEPGYSGNTFDSLSQTFAPAAVDTVNSKLALSGLKFSNFVSASSASGNPVYFSTTGTLPAPLQAGSLYYIAPNAVSGYDIYPEQGSSDWQNMPDALSFETPLTAQNFAQKTNKVALTSQGTGTHTVYSDTLVYSLVDMVGNGYTTDGRNGSSDRHSHHRIQTDGHGPFIMSRILAREFGRYAGGTFNLFGKSPIQGPPAKKLEARQRSGLKRSFWHTQVVRISINGYKSVIKNVVAPADINTTTGVVTNTNANGRFATGNLVNVQVNAGSTMPAGWDPAIDYFAHVVSSTTYTLHLNGTDATSGSNPVIPTTQGAGLIILFAPQRVGDRHRQSFLIEQIEPANSGAGNVLSPWPYPIGPTNAGIITSSGFTTSGTTNGDILNLSNYGDLARITLWFPPRAVRPTRADTGQPLADGDYYVTKYTGGSTYGRLHDTLAKAQACQGVLTNSCANTDLIKYTTAMTGEMLTVWSNSNNLLPWVLNSSQGGAATAQQSATASGPIDTNTAHYLPTNSVHVFTWLVDMNDPAQSVPIAKLYIDGVLYSTYALDGVKGILDAAQNDGTPAWTLHNSAASHVPFEGDSYGVYLGSSVNGITDAEILALHNYCLAKFGVAMSPPVPLAPSNTVAPAISGTPLIGQTLSASTGTWVGYPASTYTYQWNRSGTPVGGATASTYLLTAADDTASMTVTVTATNASGSASATSAATATVTGVATAPSNVVAPIIAGTAQATFTLSVSSPGTWNGYPAPTYAYQWKSAGVNVGGATSSSYVLQNSDVGNNVTCAVTASNASGSASATSNALGPVAAAPSYETEAAALFARGTFDAPHKTAINNWFVAVKTGANSGTNILSKLDYVGGYAVGSSPEYLFDWKTSSRTATKVTAGSGIVFTADRGIHGTLSVADYLDTQYNPSAGGVNYTQNSASLFVYVVTDATDTTSAGAADLGWIRGNIITRANTGVFTANLNAAASNYTDSLLTTTAVGSHAITRASSATVAVYHNGSAANSAFAETSAAITAGDLLVLTRTGASSYSTRTIGFAIAGGALTASEVLDLHNACNAYLHAVGAV